MGVPGVGGHSVKGPEALQQLTGSPKTPSYWGLRITGVGRLEVPQPWPVPGQPVGGSLQPGCIAACGQLVLDWHVRGPVTPRSP